jgi:hypothetical protein
MPFRGHRRLRSNELANLIRDPLDTDFSGQPSAEDVVAEIGLVLAIVLGIALAIDTVLVALHVLP